VTLDEDGRLLAVEMGVDAGALAALARGDRPGTVEST
jgi:hypothetical protein